MNPFATVTLLSLEGYPKAIALAEYAVLLAQQKARALADAVERRRAEFKGIVANDKGLSNDAKRKDMLAQLELTDANFLELQTQHQSAKDALVMAQIQAQLQRDLFRVALAIEGRSGGLGALEY